MNAPPAWPDALRPFFGMIEAGVSAIACSHDAALRPSIMRAVGSRIEEDSGELTLFLSRAHSRQLLQDVAACGHIAVVFSQPSTHRSVQVKSTRVSQRAAVAADTPTLTRYRQAMESELMAVGHDAAFVRAMLAHRIEDLMALTFVPQQAFDQTPGAARGAAGAP